MNQATPLLRDELEVVCDFLTSPSPEKVRDSLTVLLYAAEVGLAEVGRQTLDQIRKLDPADPDLARHLGRLLDTASLKHLSPTAPAVGLGKVTSPQQVRQILLRVMRRTGVEGWSTKEHFALERAIQAHNSVMGAPDVICLRDHVVFTVGWSLALRPSEIRRARFGWVGADGDQLLVLRRTEGITYPQSSVGS